MVVRLLSMGLDSRRRRLVVGRELWLLQMARPSRPAPALSARATSLLVVPASVPSSLPPANAYSHSAELDSDANSVERQADTHSTELDSDANSHLAATGPPHADSDAAEPDSNANVLGDPDSASAHAHSKVHGNSGSGEVDSDADAAKDTHTHHADTQSAYQYS
jgi:hypothetical protein